MSTKPPSFKTITTPKTPFPKAKAQPAYVRPNTNPSGRGYVPPSHEDAAAAQAIGAETTEPTTTAIHLRDVPKAGADKVLTIRQRLIKAGYNVAAQGEGTPRLEKAYAHFIATNGSGSKVWNAHNQQVVHPSVAPAHKVHPASATTQPAVDPYVDPGNGETIPTNTIPGAPSIPPALQALLDKEFSPYSGDQGQPNLTDPVKLAKAQAQQQYGGVISGYQDQISQMQGAAPGAQANISKYFAPAKAQAAANVASNDAANAENVAAQAKLSTGLMAALGLSGADGGNLAANAKSASQYAGDIGQNQHASDLAAIGATDRAEQQAHTTEDSNSTIALAAARANLLQQVGAKGQALTTNEANNRQQNFVNRTQGIANKAAISNLNATNGLAKTNIIQGILQNAGTAQTQDINQQNAGITTAQAKAAQKQAAANLQQTIINNKRLTLTPIPTAKDPNATTKIPFGQINVGDRETLATGMWGKVGNLDPAKAERQINAYMTNMYGYSSTPAIRAWAKSIVQQHQWDPKDKKYKA